MCYRLGIFSSTVILVLLFLGLALLRAQYLHPVVLVIGLLFGALSDGLCKNPVKFRGRVLVVPEYACVWVIFADSGRRVTLEANLARRGEVGAQCALVLTTLAAKLLGSGKTRVTFDELL